MTLQTSRPFWQSVPEEIKQKVKDNIRGLMPRAKREAGIESDDEYNTLLTNYMDETLRSRYNVLIAKAMKQSKNLLHLIISCSFADQRVERLPREWLKTVTKVLLS